MSQCHNVGLELSSYKTAICWRVPANDSIVTREKKEEVQATCTLACQTYSWSVLVAFRREVPGLKSTQHNCTSIWDRVNGMHSIDVFSPANWLLVQAWSDEFRPKQMG